MERRTVDGRPAAQVRARAHRLVGELVRLGLVERTPEGTYRIGLGLFVLGQPAPSVRELCDTALPYLGDLHDATQENVHPAVPDGTDTLFLEKVTGRRATPIVSRTSRRGPRPPFPAVPFTGARGVRGVVHGTLGIGHRARLPYVRPAPGRRRRWRRGVVPQRRSGGAGRQQRRSGEWNAPLPDR